MNHDELIRHLKNLSYINHSNELAQLLLLKKAENFLRDLIILEIDRSLKKDEASNQTAVREINKHDLAIMEGRLNKRGNFDFLVSTIIEMKYTTAAWILEKADDPLEDLSFGQDNIWRENMTFKSQIGKENDEKKYKIGKEPSGIKKDMEKMNDSRLPNILNRHHILALVSPKKQIPEKYKGLFWGDSVNTYKLINKHFPQKIDSNNGKTIFEKTEIVLTNQLKLVNDSFFKIAPLKSCLLNIGVIGQACGVPVELYLFVISY